MKSLRIGEVAKRLGLSRDIIRHYQRLGLISTVRRTESGYREFDPTVLGRIRAIQNALALGFTLTELEEFAQDRARGRAPCQRVRRLAEKRLADVDKELARLQLLKDALQATLLGWDQRLRDAGDAPAGLLDALANADVPIPSRPVLKRRRK
jgi:DNA-binding transcriptional MerR regulator